jgi:alpha-tubulin suppressor-like RCC1 family protein
MIGNVFRGNSMHNVDVFEKNQHGEASPPKGNFIQVSSGHSFTCGIRDNGSISCWGSIEPKEHNEKFTQISSGNFHACALKKSGDIKCFGKNDSKESEPPKGPFMQVSCGLHHSCAIRRNGYAECWGKNDLGQSHPPRTMSFKQISAGSKSHVCGLGLEKGNVLCWGSNSHGQGQSREGKV